MMCEYAKTLTKNLTIGKNKHAESRDGSQLTLK